MKAMSFIKLISIITCCLLTLTLLCSCSSHNEAKWDENYNSGIYDRPIITESATSVLKFSNIKIEHNSSYTVCTGTITNNGKKTYKFVKIKGSFENYSGQVIDTDWTYAVGSEGIAPKESKTFRMSVPKDWDIKKCDISILDYDN